MISNCFKVLFFLIFINAQCYALDSFEIDEKTSLFSAKHMTAPVITTHYIGWQADWKWAGAIINPEYNHQQSPYSGSTFTGRVDNLDIDFTGEVTVSEKQIDWTYQWDKKSDFPDAIGFGIQFDLELYSLGFLEGAKEPELLPDNKGWRWETTNGQTIEVTFSPALASIYFGNMQKSVVRALFFTDISQGTQQTVMTIKASQNVSVSGPTVLDYDNSDQTLWHKDLLPKVTSPIDLSFLNTNDKPAGKRGFIVADKDQLFFADNTPAKFWGTNIQANALFRSSDADIELHAKRIAKFGFNLVRIHHHDSVWVDPNIFKNPTNNTLEFSDESLRKIDWWIKCLKAEGVYIWLDLHVGRAVTNNDGIDNFDDFAKGKSQVEIRGFNYYNETIQSALQAFNDAYLNHINAYTGVAYKDDPAVISMLITNENDLTQHFGNALLADKNVPIHHDLFSQDARQFSETYGLSEDKVKRTWLMGESKIYLNDAEHRFNEKMIEHLDLLGVKSLVATTNSWGGMGLFGLPSLTDGSIIDAHSYGRAEEFKFNPRFNPGFLTWAGAAQVSGKPLSFTEWNIEPFPARDRFTAPIYTASIANLQGWDAIMQYGYNQDTTWGTRGSNYSSQNDPGIMALMPAAALLYRQNHVAPAKKSYELKLNRNDFFFARQDPRSSKTIRTLLETSRFTIGMPDTPELPWLVNNTVASENALVINNANQDFIPAGQNFVESDTNELKRDWETGIHTINTTKSQIASGWIGGKTIDLDDVSFNIITKKAVVAVQSLENKPINESNKIFISVMARSKPEIENRIPFISEPVTGQISIQAPEGLKLFPVNSNGFLDEQIITNRDAEGKYIINLSSEMKTHWFKLQSETIPFHITSPANNSTFSHSQQITIKTNSSILEGNIAQLQFMNSNGDILESVTSAPYEYAISGLPAGEHTITALITYDDSTSESESVTFTVGAAPFSITSPSNGTSFNISEPVVIKTNASLIEGNIKHVTFWHDNWRWLGDIKSPPYEFIISNLSPDEHILRSRLIFQDGTSLSAENITITVNEETSFPQVSNIQQSVTETTATISWDTDILSDSTVNYGLDSSYGAFETDASLVTSHGITLTGLTADTEYHYQLISTDANGNTNTPEDLVFTTASIIPPVVPVVSNVLTTITDTTAVITWNTDILSDSTVNYGLDSSYGAFETDASLVTSHSIALTGLTADTEYHYQLISTDAKGNSNTPVDLVFTTASIIPPIVPVVSNVQTSITDTTAIITWDTDVLSDSTVNYGLDSSYGEFETDASLVTSHSMTLTGLTAETEYFYQVISTDADNNSSIPVDLQFTTETSADITAPVISNINKTVTDTTAIITWDTNEPADSAVSYGLDNSYGSMVDSTVLVTSHNLELTNLTPATPYHFEISSADASKNISSSADQVFTTEITPDTTPPVISNIQTTVTETTATITWDTDETSDSSINYGLASSYGSTINNADLDTAHSLLLNGLTPDTEYHFEISSTDASTNTTVSADLVFTTTTASQGDETLLAQWLLDEGSGITANDNSGNGLHGILTNDPAWSGNELLFDGIDDYVNVGKLDISGSELTLTGWAQSDDLANCNSRDCRLLSKATSPSGQDHYWMLSTIKSGGKTRLRFRLKTNGSTATLIASSGDLSNGERFHAAAVYDGSSMRLYKNGVLVGSRAKTGIIDTNNEVDVWIGSNPTVATSRPWEGSIADVRIYQRALSTEEVNLVKDGHDLGDNTPPQVSNIQQSVTETTATITWDTDVLSDSTVNYGLDNSYGAFETDASLVTSHSITLTGLTADTEYHYQLISTDANGNSNSPVDLVLTTASIIAPVIPVVSNVQTTVTDTTAIITWDTDVLSDSTVNYGLDSSYGAFETDTSLITSHSITLTGLTAETEYFYQVISTDADNNSSIPVELQFTTENNADITAPVISNINKTVTDTTAIITWDTNEPADSAVSYGLDNSYGSMVDSAVLVTSHSLELTNLTPATPYHFEISSADASKNISSSADQVFTTEITPDTTPPVISNIQTTVTETTATITWDTDETSDSSINYGLDSSYGSTINNADLDTTHSLLLNALTPGTEYHFEISSTDASTNTTVSADLVFTTTTASQGDETLLAQWLLDEGSGITANDHSGNGLHGILTNDPAWSGNELLFDGIDDYVNVGKLDISGSELTLAGWAQSDDLANCNSRDCRLLSKATSPSGQDHYWMLSTIKSGGKTRLRFRLKTNGSTATLIASSGDLSNGERFHAAAVYDGSSMRLYKNGVLVGSRAKTGIIDTNNEVDVWIGSNPTVATSRPWEGSIADVRIYQRALSTEEINLVKDGL